MGFILRRRELPCKVGSEIIDSTTKFGGPLRFQQELVENSYDAWANEIYETGIEKPKPNIKIVLIASGNETKGKKSSTIDTITVLDDGPGPDQEGRDTISNWGDSPKKKVNAPGVKGRNNTGLKTLRHVCNDVCFTSYCHKDREVEKQLLAEHKLSGNVVYQIAYDKKKQGEALLGKLEAQKKGVTTFEKLEELAIIRPDDFYLPAGQSGMVITMTNFFPKRLPTKEDIIAGLADCLEPYVATCVTVHEQSPNNPGERLTPRKIIGSKEGTFTYVVKGAEATPRKAYYSIYIPQSEGSDDLHMGSGGKVCSMKAFVKKATERQMHFFPKNLWLVKGRIDIPHFDKEGYVPQERESFSADLFLVKELEITTLFYELDKHLSPIIAKMVGNTEFGNNPELQVKALKHVAKTFNEKFQYSEQDPSLMSIIPFQHEIEMCVGDEVVLGIKSSTGVTGDICYDFSDTDILEMGEQDDNNCVLVKACHPGLVTVRVYDSDNTGTQAKIKIHIGTEKIFRIYPGSVNIPPGGKARLHLENTEKTSGEFVWSIENPSNSASLVKLTGKENECIAGKTEGLIYVKVYDKNKPSDFCVYSAINVVQALKKNGHGKFADTFNPKIKVVSILFSVKIRRLALKDVSCNVFSEGALYTLDINANYPAFMAAERDGLKSLQGFLTRLLIMQYVLVAFPNNRDPKHAFDRVLQIEEELKK